MNVHKGYNSPNTSTPPNTSLSDDCMSKPASVISINTLPGDYGAKKINVDMIEPKRHRKDKN